MTDMQAILCPTDFTETANNGIEYAAQVARSLNRHLLLTYVRPSIWPEAIQLDREVMVSTRNISELLYQKCREIQMKYDVTCLFHLEITTSTFEQAIAARASQCDLIVMGTNGAENYYQQVFGSNTYQVIEEAKCPVLMVPSGCSFKPIHNLVYAYDDETNPIFLIDQLKKVVIPLDIKVEVLHIVETEPSEKNDRKIVRMKSSIQARFPTGSDWSVDFQYSDDVPRALNQYMKKQDAEILALTFHHRSLIDNLLTEDVIKKMSVIAEYPVLIFWH
jgi:nucleotide-binding universal stress UspA family protein